MRKLILVSAVLLLASCTQSSPSYHTQSSPSYQLIIGEETVQLPVHADPKRIQDDIVAHVRPLWEKLDSGRSLTFYYQRTVPFEFGPTKEDLEEKARALLGPNASVTSTATKTGPRLRFFKRQNGLNGAEMVDAAGKHNEVCFSGNFEDWRTVESLLRSSVFPTDRIRALQQWAREVVRQNVDRVIDSMPGLPYSPIVSFF